MLLVHGGGRRVERMLNALGDPVALRRRAARDLAGGDGRGGDGALRRRSTRAGGRAHRRRRPGGRRLGPRRRRSSARGWRRISAAWARPSGWTRRYWTHCGTRACCPSCRRSRAGRRGKPSTSTRTRPRWRWRRAPAARSLASTFPTWTACTRSRATRRRRSTAASAQRLMDAGVIAEAWRLKVRVALQAAAAGIPR